MYYYNSDILKVQATVYRFLPPPSLRSVFAIVKVEAFPLPANLFVKNVTPFCSALNTYMK